jgi:hypothetical protein
VTLDIDSVGQIFAKCQVTDYICRGEALASYNMLDFFVDTYEADISRAERDQNTGNNDDDDDSEGSDMDDLGRKPGRPRHDRVRYLTHHPKAKQKQRVLRSRGHRNLPNFVGRYFPRRDDPKIYPFYCACMLLLLKPWRDIQKDLKSQTQTWPEAFSTFIHQASRRTHFILSGIQYFHECESAAKERRQEDDILVEEDPRHHFDRQADEDYELGEDFVEVENEYSEEGLAKLIASQTPVEELTHALLAVEIAKRAKIFTNECSRWSVNEGGSVGNATGDDLTKLMQWKVQMKKDVVSQNTDSDAPHAMDIEPGFGGQVNRLTEVEQSHGEVSILAPEASLPAVDPALLRSDQFRAFDIITWHLDQTLSGNEPPPLRMILYGEGGTGKSKVIQTVTETFAQKGVKYMLVKSAYTGVAASLIDGKTTHTLASLSMTSDGNLSDESKAKLQKQWQSRRYLIIDEYSMLAKSFLATLSRNISIGKQGSSSEKPGLSFGGVNVILCGDLHQFPPVAKSSAESLYRPTNLASDSTECQIGRAIYEEFKTVVILKEQMRVTDPIWRDLLVHLRYGRIQERHIQILRSLVVHRSQSKDRVDFKSEPWASAPLITPRHAVRKVWNESAARKSCRESGEQLFVCTAEDTIGGRKLSLPEQYALAARSKTESRRKRKDLPSKIEIAKGMKVLVTNNIETDLDVTNGARGEIVDIILHPDEPPISANEPVVHLKYLPSYLLVKLSRTRASRLAGLEDAVIPVEVETSSMKISIRVRGGKTVERTVRRRQYPVTAAYSFTDYRSQGQTIPYVIVDIAKPPSGTLTLFNLYVALSRSSGRDTIRLLRDFDERLFMQLHDLDLMDEDDRLEELNQLTLQWWRKMGRGRSDDGE